MNKETIHDGQYVEYAYKLYDEDGGKLLFEASPDAPDVLVYGVSQEVIPGLIAAIKGLAAGDKFSATLPPEAAFGSRSDEYLIDVERDAFGDELPETVKPGAVLPMLTDRGFTVRGEVLEVGPETVRMDFNHPFAGKTVRFEGEILKVRPATPDELKPSCGCGCGDGCHGGCGDDGCHGGCGDNCSR